jgi:hypothetical protein
MTALPSRQVLHQRSVEFDIDLHIVSTGTTGYRQNQLYPSSWVQPT